MPALTPPVVAGLPLEQPTLDAGPFTLRPWRGTDASDLLAVYADPAVQRWHCQTLTPVEAAHYAATWAGLWSAGTRAGWAVVRSTALVGRITLGRLDLEGGQAEVTYWTVPAARGSGVAPLAVTALTAWSFQLGLQRLELQHSTQNRSSCRVAEKVGFALEGTKRRAGLHLDGWHDMHLHARLSPGR